MTYVVIGSGPSGANAALTLLKRGKEVEVWDVGRTEEAFPAPHATLHQLKELLEDPQAYFLGEDFRALVPPGSSELLPYPPSRSFLLREEDPLYPIRGSGFSPFLSFNKGGLGVGWGGNALCYDEDDFKDFPVSFKDYEGAFEEAFRRIPVAGPLRDDLSAFLPGVRVSQPPIQLNRHDAALHQAYTRNAAAVQKRFSIRIGKARMAVVTNAGRADSCRYCARCLWGCPFGSIYDPRKSTLEECERYPQFRFRAGRLVLNMDAFNGKVISVRYVDLANGQTRSETCQAAFLAAGAIQTGAIFLRTLQADERTLSGRIEARTTKSIMDTCLLKIPYLQLRCVGRSDPEDGFQFNKLILAHIDPGSGRWPSYIHGEILSLTGLLYYSLIETLPLGSRFSKELFFLLKSALGVVTLFFPDRPEQGNGLSLESDRSSATGDRIRIRYGESSEKADLIRRVVKDTCGALRSLRCIVHKKGIFQGPAGTGIHYAGTVPMGPPNDPLTSDSKGRANAYENLYIADGAAFPSLPSKSITMSLVAHAIRVAQAAP